MNNTTLNYGSVDLELCGSIEAGSFSTVKYTFITDHPIENDGYIKIVFRSAGDFGTPQFHKPEQDNYCTIATTGRCRVVPRWDDKGHTSPWGKSLFLKVSNGFLAKGSQVTVTFGDTSQGSKGWQLQTFLDEKFTFKTLIDPLATYQFKEISNSPSMPIIPGVPISATCIAPTQVKVDEEFTFYLKVEDKWGNPASAMDKIIHPGFPDSGVDFIEISDRENNLDARSNPICIQPKSTEYNYYWADFNGQSEETIGINDIEDYFYFGCYWSRLNILGHQGRDFQITDEFWQRIKDTSDAYDETDQFVSFPGYQWSGSTLFGGDRSVFFADSSGNISRSSREMLPDAKSKFPDSNTAEELFKSLDTQSTNSFTFAQAGSRYADISTHDDLLEVAVEVHSAKGTFEWLLDDAFRRGYRVGICANSGTLKCRPGSGHPGNDISESHGGLTCVLASELNRNKVFGAIQKRHFYATTGNRCFLDVKLKIENKNAAIMGDVITLTKRTLPVLSIKAAGTAPVEKLEIYNGSKLICTERNYTPEELGSTIKVIWSGAEVKGCNRDVDWSGKLVVIDNQIKSIKSVNFWNPDAQPVIINANQVEWNSITTGGLAGMIIELEHQKQGKLQIETVQGVVIYDLSRDGFLPQKYKFGGLKKNISVYRIPDNYNANKISYKYDIDSLFEGDNPIYVKMIQVDGHTAWSSPIYIIS